MSLQTRLASLISAIGADVKGLSQKVLTPIAVKTASYTASPGEFILLDTSSADILLTLPPNPPTGTRVGAFWTGGGGHTATVGASAGDTLAGGFGGTQLTVGGSVTWIFIGSNRTWYRLTDSMPDQSSAPSIRNLGTGANNAAAGNDARFTGGPNTIARAFRNAVLTSSAGIFHMLLDTENYDPGNNYNNTGVGSHPYAYTCPSAGYYLVVAAVYAYTTSAAQIVSPFIYKNGGMVSQGSGGTANGGANGFVAEIIYCAAGDYLELWAYTGGVAGLSMPAGTPNAYNYMSVMRVA